MSNRTLLMERPNEEVRPNELKKMTEMFGLNWTLRSGGEGSIETADVARTGVMAIQTWKWDHRKPQTLTIEVPDQHAVILVCLEGIALTQGPDSDQWLILPKRSVAVASGPGKYTLEQARGVGQWVVAVWPIAAAAGLSHWLRAKTKSLGESDRALRITSCGRSSFTGVLFDRMVTLTGASGDRAAVEALGLVHLFSAAGFASRPTINLSEIEAELPEALRHLVAAVKQDPREPWSLKDAATHAGYSPFHLSRTFRQLAGYGFPEFVDRCRAEIAIVALLTGSEPIESIAESSGFGSVQALRDACREYIGLLPSELRNLHAAPV